MFKRLLAGWIAVAWLTTSDTATAQSASSQRVRELTEQFDSILPLLVSAESTYRAQSVALQNAEAAKQAERLDTAGVGPFTVVARPAYLAEASEYIADIWRDFEIHARGADRRLAGVTLLVEGNNSVPMFRRMSQRPGHVLLSIPTILALRARRAYGMRAVGSHLTAAAPPAVQTWLKGAALSWQGEHAAAYRELAVGRSEAAARCLRQDTQGCVAALALSEPDSVWSTWYTGAQLREFARQAAFGVPALRTPILDACMRRSDVENCAAFMRSIGGVPAPLSPTVRVGFLQYALQQGGEGSYARLLESDGGLIQAVEQAARQPIDKLVSGWRAEVQKARPEMHAGMTRSRLAILFWLLVCVGLAMRSTRWRLA